MLSIHRWLDFFWFYPNKTLRTRLRQAQLLMIRLNEDQDIDIPKVKTNLQKHFKDFKDEVISSYESFLMLGRKVAEFEELGYIIDPWFQERMTSLTNHMIMVQDLLDYDDQERVLKLVLDFYKGKGY